MQKTNNKATMKRVLKYIRKYTPALVLSLLLAGLTVLLPYISLSSPVMRWI